MKRRDLGTRPRVVATLVAAALALPLAVRPAAGGGSAAPARTVDDDAPRDGFARLADALERFGVPRRASEALAESTLAAGTAKYFPAWHAVAPERVLPFPYAAGQTPSQNGASLVAAAKALQPGDRLVVSGGTYVLSGVVDLCLVGTAERPIWIVAAPGEAVVLRREGASQNGLELGAGGPTRYLCLRGITLEGGSIGLRLHDCAQVWIDRCEIRGTAENALAANTRPTEHLYLTRNHVHHTSGSGEGFYVGGNFGDPVASQCVIALNHVHDTGGSQGDGIEVKQGSWGNWIAQNLVHHTNFPAILVYGTGGMPPNVVERNACILSNDNAMQVQGEALVRNNVIFGGISGFASQPHQGEPRHLRFVHNTIVNVGEACRLSSWSGKPGMVFANNACYSQIGQAIRFAGGSDGVTVAGNVVHGPVSGVSAGFTVGNGLADFHGAAWDASALDVTVPPGSALVGAADPALAEAVDFLGLPRVAPFTAGALGDY